MKGDIFTLDLWVMVLLERLMIFVIYFTWSFDEFLDFFHPRTDKILYFGQILTKIANFWWIFWRNSLFFPLRPIDAIRHYFSQLFDKIRDFFFFIIILTKFKISCSRSVTISCWNLDFLYDRLPNFAYYFALLKLVSQFFCSNVWKNSWLSTVTDWQLKKKKIFSLPSFDEVCVFLRQTYEHNFFLQPTGENRDCFHDHLIKFVIIIFNDWQKLSYFWHLLTKITFMIKELNI